MSIRTVRKQRPDPAAIAKSWLRRECLLGNLPAEVLSTQDREHLVHTLWNRGWTDAEIASHTLMSTYTSARIRKRLNLAPNRAVEGVA